MNLRTMNNRTRTASGVLTLLGGLAACAGAPPPGQAGAPEAKSAPRDEARSAVTAESPAAPATPPALAATTASAAGAPAPERAGACPSGMVAIPGGAFMMGDKDGRDDELPVHRVTLDAFCLDVTLVTVGAYARCTTCPAPNRGRNHNEAGQGKDDHPRNGISWDAAMAYCKSQGKTLPTEAQWEYAARGGTEQRKWTLGSEPTSSTACIDRMGRQGTQDKGTCPVGAYPAGAFGLMDMVGNVWEWTADWYGPYRPGAQKNPTGPSSGEMRSMRGGAWDQYSGAELRGALRGSYPPDTWMHHVGVRCAKAL
jgi:formylglycine-generating enzyme required for sulfatase activity